MKKEDHRSMYQEWNRAINKRNYPLAERQNWECSICRVVPKRKLHWDHNHKTGAYRAMLCPACNSGLGMFKDDSNLLRKAALYLELHGD